RLKLFRRKVLHLKYRYLLAVNRTTSITLQLALGSLSPSESFLSPARVAHRLPRRGLLVSGTHIPLQFAWRPASGPVQARRRGRMAHVPALHARAEILGAFNLFRERHCIRIKLLGPLGPLGCS